MRSVMDRAGVASSRVMAATAVGSAGVRGQEGAREVETAELLVQGIAQPVATIASLLALRWAMRVRLTLSATRELIEAAITLTVTPALTSQQSVVRAQ